MNDTVPELIRWSATGNCPYVAARVGF